MTHHKKIKNSVNYYQGERDIYIIDKDLRKMTRINHTAYPPKVKVSYIDLCNISRYIEEANRLKIVMGKSIVYVDIINNPHIPICIPCPEIVELLKKYPKISMTAYEVGIS
jgi:hypothetical protein